MRYYICNHQAKILLLFEENCPGGCPCENYSCGQSSTSPDVTTVTAPPSTTTATTTTTTTTTTSTTTTTTTTTTTAMSPGGQAVLVLNTYDPNNKPMIIDFDGEFNLNIELK